MEYITELPRNPLGGGFDNTDDVPSDDVDYFKVDSPHQFDAVEDWAYRLTGDSDWADDPSYSLPHGFHVTPAGQHSVVIGGPVKESWRDARGGCGFPNCGHGDDGKPAQAYFASELPSPVCKWHHDLLWYQAGQPRTGPILTVTPWWLRDKH